jgi:hypothetical protein
MLATLPVMPGPIRIDASVIDPVFSADADPARHWGAAKKSPLVPLNSRLGSRHAGQRPSSNLGGPALLTAPYKD